MRGEALPARKTLDRCFRSQRTPVFIGLYGLAGCIFAGLAAGALSALLTLGVYAAEDLFPEGDSPNPLDVVAGDRVVCL